MLAPLLMALGIAFLLGGGVAMVRGASDIAQRSGISPMVVGLTVVAFGTSAPELVVNLVGAVQGETQLAFGNVVGSNIANLGLILGLTGLVTPITIQGQLVRREVPLLLLGTSILLVQAGDHPLSQETNMLDRGDGIVLLLVFTIFIYITVSDILRQRKDPLLVGLEHMPTTGKQLEARRDWILVIVGVLGLSIGGQLVITYGAQLAEQLNWSKAMVGMVIVALGTSLPELVTSVIAAIRKEPDLCVGNVIGSNLFNGLLVLPLSAVVRPLEVPKGGGGDLLMSFVFAGLLIPIFIIGQARLGRRAAALLLASYLIYVIYRVTATSG